MVQLKMIGWKRPLVCTCSKFVQSQKSGKLQLCSSTRRSPWHKKLLSSFISLVFCILLRNPQTPGMDVRRSSKLILILFCLVLLKIEIAHCQTQAALVDEWVCNTARHLASPCNVSEEQCYTKCLCRANDGWSTSQGPWQGGYCNAKDECVCCNAHGNAGGEQLPSGNVITCI
eukprot:jgi/Botrbrau1/15782/Bobra.4_1s0134.1